MPQKFDGITWGIVGVEDFLRKYMTPLTDETSMVEDIQTRTATLLDRVKQDIKNETTEDTKTLRPPLVAYLAELVSKFRNKPIVRDTHNRVFEPPDEEDDGDDFTKPDITVSRPRITFEPTQWAHAGTVVELKYNTDIFEDADSDINDWDTDRLEILVQLTGSARSLLQFSRSCHVYVVTCFNDGMARILRFDRAGFEVTQAFNWLESKTSSRPSFSACITRLARITWTARTTPYAIRRQKKSSNCTQRLCRHGFYAERTHAVRFGFEDGKRVSKVVSCLTIHHSLSYAGGMFGRATRVSRVMLKEDLNSEKPTIYALKCRGSVDLAVEGASLRWNPVLHVTRSTKSSDPTLERRHTRTLLTPVGSPLNSFKSTKSLADALRNAVRHCLRCRRAATATSARGTSLFEEVTDADRNLKGFLVDWDYAEFTEDDSIFSRELFRSSPSRWSVICESKAKEETLHAAEHDLESVYWLLVWMILRHTDHGHSDGNMACSNLFDTTRIDSKFTQSGPLFRLAEDLVQQVKLQNPSYYSEVPVQKMTHAKVLETFETHLKAADWPTNDPGLPFHPPSNPSRQTGKSPKPPPVWA
ncbi:hypothetical protein B0H14DRAFT_3680888 [Mycena olivaceomarginata]|nr:hypothetical protein B0H14DRAFT_3680888 [Mycena olivaceomarginata]